MYYPCLIHILPFQQTRCYNIITFSASAWASDPDQTQLSVIRLKTQGRELLAVPCWGLKIVRQCILRFEEIHLYFHQSRLQFWNPTEYSYAYHTEK